ncbi:MAG: hypothetical protein OWV35_10995, partial [Firmicutes bacterium]|nr:hypothetical protein [Bacillota bacterium]
RSYAGWPRPRILARGRFPPAAGEPLWHYGPEGLSAWLVGPGGPQAVLPAPGAPPPPATEARVVYDSARGPQLWWPDPPPARPAPPPAWEARLTALERQVRQLQAALQARPPAPAVAAPPDPPPPPRAAAEPPPRPPPARHRCRWWLRRPDPHSLPWR